MLEQQVLVVELHREETDEETVNKINSLQVELMEESFDKPTTILEELLSKDVKIVSQKIDKVDKELALNNL